jgi:hypothetical protein
MIFAKLSVTTALLAGLASVAAAGQPRPSWHWSWTRQSTTGPGTAAAATCHAGSDVRYKSALHNPQLFFRPSNGTSVSYPRVVELQDGTILATAAYTGRIAGKRYFPIFASCDGGNTWAWRGNVTDPVNGSGLSAQPALAELPWDLGVFKKGTVLAAGLGYNNDTGAMIDLYASEDKGTTWRFVSNVAQSRRGGLFEPFIL